MLSATLAQPVTLTGRGLFSGAPCRALIEPAPPCAGLTIRSGTGPAVPLTIEHIVERPSCSVIDTGGDEIAVVEHLLAALWAAGIDTAAITVDGPEVPNQDGSSLPIFEAVSLAGRIQAGPRPRLELRRSLRVAEDGSYLQIEPADELSVAYSFSHPELGEQHYAATLTRESTVREILAARSFITDREAAAAKAAGLIQHDNVEDALVLHVTNGKVQPASPLRFPDEFARHKVLDMLGDLYLAPCEWTGRLTAHRSGHRLNRMLARRIYEECRSQRQPGGAWES